MEILAVARSVWPIVVGYVLGFAIVGPLFDGLKLLG